MQQPPEHYLSLFDGRLRLETDLLLDRPPLPADFDALLKSWREEETASLALVGPQGAGKTTQLHLMANGISQPLMANLLCPNVRINGENALWAFLMREMGLEGEPASLEEAAEKILAGPRRAIFLDDAHLLWLRVMGGLEGLRHFLLLLEATTPHCFWVAAFNEVCWRRLDYLLNASRHFSHVWELPYFQPAELREALEKRQSKSGLALSFSQEIIRGKTSSGDERKEAFFKQLCDASAGNFQAASALWRKSALWDQDAGSVVMQPLQTLAQKLPDWLGPATNCAMVELLGHGGMTVEELSDVFIWKDDEVLAFLAPLLRKGFLEIMDNGYHRISSLYRPLVKSAMAQAGLLPGEGQ